jgi:hypothetical protein
MRKLLIGRARHSSVRLHVLRSLRATLCTLLPLHAGVLEVDRGTWYTEHMTDADKYRHNAATTAQLIDAGIAVMRQNIRRRFPEETEAGIDARLKAWLHRTDDAIPGDVAGPVRVRERMP